MSYAIIRSTWVHHCMSGREGDLVCDIVSVHKSKKSAEMTAAALRLKPVHRKFKDMTAFHTEYDVAETPEEISE